MQIMTKRILLRDFVEGDVPAFLSYHEDPRALAFYGPQERQPAYGRELLECFTRWAAEHPRRNYQFAIVQRREPRSLIGCGGVRTAESEQVTGMPWRLRQPSSISGSTNYTAGALRQNREHQ
ncbi:MAG: hypothetical protein A4E19_20500 [Nitrospira sp. SG-bin1]|nr:MAG: hypothetical protein A4E19_20500 [Nitrospira sp. SG-bin1]